MSCVGCRFSSVSLLTGWALSCMGNTKDNKVISVLITSRILPLFIGLLYTFFRHAASLYFHDDIAFLMENTAKIVTIYFL